MCGRKMEVAIVASFPAKRYVNVDACHILCFATKKDGDRHRFQLIRQVSDLLIPSHILSFHIV